MYVCTYNVRILRVFPYFHHCITLLVFSCLFCFCFLIKLRHSAFGSSGLLLVAQEGPGAASVALRALGCSLFGPSTVFLRLIVPTRYRVHLGSEPDTVMDWRENKYSVTVTVTVNTFPNFKRSHTEAPRAHRVCNLVTVTPRSRTIYFSNLL
jgi:hypothetical protein